MTYFIRYQNLDKKEVIYEEKVASSAEVPQKTCTLHIGCESYIIDDIDYYTLQEPDKEHNGSYAVVYLKEV